MSRTNPDRPYCFADLETVFPKGTDGLRHSPEACFYCRSKTDCLREAMKGESGIEVREEMVDRAYDSGTVGFFSRWSRRKALHNRRGEKGKRGKGEDHEKS